MGPLYGVGGNQPLGSIFVVSTIAKACGYKRAVTVSSMEDIKSILKDILATEGPSLIEIKVGIKSREDLGRPKTTPIENKDAFMKFINC